MRGAANRVEQKLKYPIAKFSANSRVYKFCEGVEQVDLGRSSAYWVMQDQRPCISEHSVDRSGQIFETYFFSNQGMTDNSDVDLFAAVKAAHKTYTHDLDIEYSARTVTDDHQHTFWSLSVKIADNQRLYRDRKPFWKWYETPEPGISLWSLYQTYCKAQRKQIPFILIEGETGDPSWGDRDIYKTVLMGSEEELRQRLNALPKVSPPDNYVKFNQGVIDARDPDRPFNESAYTLAKDYEI